MKPFEPVIFIVLVFEIFFNVFPANGLIEPE